MTWGLFIVSDSGKVAGPLRRVLVFCAEPAPRSAPPSEQVRRGKAHAVRLLNTVDCAGDFPQESGTFRPLSWLNLRLVKRSPHHPGRRRRPPMSTTKSRKCALWPPTSDHGAT